MKLKITLKDIFDIPGAEIINPDEYKAVSSVSIDSRNINKNALFVAIKGEKFDGHEFVNDALKNGASSVVIHRKRYNEFEDIDNTLILVDDTVKALGYLAKVWRKKLKAKVISITGSAGKTTTKDMIAEILSVKYKVNKTFANNNNHIGVPLTIFSTKKSHDFLVLEHGTNHFGEIAYTADIAQPDYALITNIGNSHLEFLKNKKGVLEEKKSLLQSAKENKGILFINNDDELLSNIYKNYKRRVTYGRDKKSDIKGKILKYTDDGKPVIELRYNNKKIITESPLYGEQSFNNLLAASAVGLKLGLSKKELIKGIKKLKSPDKRLNAVRLKDFMIIDDTYNANPESMKASIELLSKINIYKKKIAVLGDMFELGNNSEKFHKALSSIIKKNKVDEVYTTGKLMKHLHSSLQKSKVVSKYFADRKSLAEFVSQYDFTGSVVLVKGSRGMKMEEFVKIIKEKNNALLSV